MSKIFKSNRKKYILITIISYITIFVVCCVLLYMLPPLDSYSDVPGVFDLPVEEANTDNVDNSDISDRIKLISYNLEEVSSELSKIQTELEGRIKYVESLKEEAEIAENVINLSNGQVNAIQAKLNQELEASSRKSFFQSIFINAFFFFLGLIVQPILKTIKKRFYKKSSNDTSISYDHKYTSDEVAQAIRLLDTINQKKFY